MSEISFSPRWREELVAHSSAGTLVLELAMGSYHVYFPSKTLWQKLAPGWALERWDLYFDECSKWCLQKKIPISVVDNTFMYEEK